jgi:hypothetical protein
MKLNGGARRVSTANSAVCYSVEITAVDPSEWTCFGKRFSEEKCASLPMSQGATSSYAMIFHFSLSLAQSRVKAAACSPGVRKLKSKA